MMRVLLALEVNGVDWGHCYYLGGRGRTRVRTRTALGATTLLVLVYIEP